MREWAESVPGVVHFGSKTDTKYGGGCIMDLFVWWLEGGEGKTV
jgi:hypothetical protein